MVWGGVRRDKVVRGCARVDVDVGGGIPVKKDHWKCIVHDSR